MDRSPAPEGLPPDLRLLKGLVTALTAVMILGLITVIVLLVIRLPAALPPVPVPESFELPEGTRPVAVTRGRDWFAVVTEDGRILFLDAAGRLEREVSRR